MDSEHEAGARLAKELLGRLRERLLSKQKIFGESEIDLAEAVAKVRVDLRIPVDAACDAIRLAFCLAPQFANADALIESGEIISIRLGASDDLSSMADVLVGALDDKSRFVRRNPREEIHSGDRLLVFTVPSSLSGQSYSRVVAEANERALAMIVMHHEDVVVPHLFANRLFAANLPPFAGHMLPLLFEACLENVSGQPFDFPPDEVLDPRDLVAFVRRRRSVADCVADLLPKLPSASAAEEALTPSDRMPPTKRLEDLHGFGEAQKWGLELMQDFELWKAGKIEWSDLDHTALVLHGPPGTGKTSFARILAENLDVSLIDTSVAIWCAGDHLGGAIQKMEAAFAAAHLAVPCVLFIDELDGITNRASSASYNKAFWGQIVNRFLELVSLARKTEGTILVGATNFIDRIDAAVLRSGRMDHTIHLGPPDAASIVGILFEYTKGAFRASELRPIAERAIGFTGADLEKLVKGARAAARRLGRSMELADLSDHIPDPHQGMSLMAQARIAVYRTGQRLAAEALGLAEMAPQDETRDLNQIMSRFVGETLFPTRQELDSFLTVIMAGRAGEGLTFGEVSILGAGTPSSDLALATTVAELIEFRSGLGTAGPAYLHGATASMDGLAGTAVGQHVAAALARATNLLTPFVQELKSAGGRFSERHHNRVTLN